MIILGAVLGTFALLWAIFTFIVKPRSKSNVLKSAPPPAAQSAPQTTPTKPANKLADGLNAGAAILGAFGQTATALGIKI